MRPALRLVVVAVFSLGLAACNPCARISNAEAGISEKSKACGSVDASWSSSRLSSCEQGLGKCTPEDNKKLDEYAACLNAIPACSSGAALSFGIARAECAGKVLGVSIACLAAVNGQ